MSYARMVRTIGILFVVPNAFALTLYLVCRGSVVAGLAVEPSVADAIAATLLPALVTMSLLLGTVAIRAPRQQVRSSTAVGHLYLVATLPGLVAVFLFMLEAMGLSLGFVTDPTALTVELGLLEGGVAGALLTHIVNASPSRRVVLETLEPFDQTEPKWREVKGKGTAILLTSENLGRTTERLVIEDVDYDEFRAHANSTDNVVAIKWVPLSVAPLHEVRSGACGVRCVARCAEPGCVCVGGTCR